MVTIRMPNGEEKCLSAENLGPVKWLKDKIFKETGVAQALQVLLINGRILGDGSGFLSKRQVTRTDSHR